MQYKLIKGAGPGDLVHQLQVAADEGWSPVGSVFIQQTVGQKWYCLIVKRSR